MNFIPNQNSETFLNLYHVGSKYMIGLPTVKKYAERKLKVEGFSSQIKTVLKQLDEFDEECDIHVQEYHRIVSFRVWVEKNVISKSEFIHQLCLAKNKDPEFGRSATLGCYTVEFPFQNEACPIYERYVLGQEGMSQRVYDVLQKYCAFSEEEMVKIAKSTGRDLIMGDAVYLFHPQNFKNSLRISFESRGEIDLSCYFE